MVNIGGRSKGCSPCRRRRVKCGKLFIVRECTRPAKLSARRKPPDLYEVRKKVALNAQVQETSLSSRARSSSLEGLIRAVPVSTGDTGSASHQLPLSASLTGNEVEIYICYTQKFIRRGGAIDLALQEVQLADIITAGSATGNGQVFHQAFLSFALVMFGSQHKQSQITDQGYAIHGLALRQLNQALSDLNCRVRDEVFLSPLWLYCSVSCPPAQNTT